MTRISLFLLLSTAFAACLSAQIGFTNRTDLLNPFDHFSGVPIAITDMNGDGLDDIIRVDSTTELNIQLQTTPGQAFASSYSIVFTDFELNWGMCTADINNDGLGDWLIGGKYNGIKIGRTTVGGAFNLQKITSPLTFVQGVNFVDINNDGWLDAFVCHDDGISRIFGNDGDGTFSYQPDWMPLYTVPPSDNSGNYGSVWSDINNDGFLDLYIAHCRQGVTDPTDPVRINQLFLNNGDGTYTQDIDNNSGLRIGAQSWTADFGDIDNDGDFDCFITNHDVPCQLLENDGAGHFTDISATAGFIGDIQGLPVQGIFRDFDNDGFTDLIVAGQKHYLFRNNGNKTFSTLPNPFNNNIVESLAIGDLNNDGFPDIYAGYAMVFNKPSTTPDVLWMNNGNNNHFYGLNLHGLQSNRNGVGAKVRVYSALGIQTREVRSGESYGISNSLKIQFGLGQNTKIDSVVVNWPSGVRDVLVHPEIDRYILLYEGGCIAPTATLLPDGPTTFCTGQSVPLSTSAPFSTYLWNTGDTTAQISVTTAGTYMVTVTNAEGCTGVSDAVVFMTDPIQVPTIEALGDTTFCAGGTVVLHCSEASSYLWNTGETSQNIAVNQSGQYTVAALGLCAFATAIPMQVTVLEAPLPVFAPDTILSGEIATLVASGNIVTWYASETDQINLAVNDTLDTPPLTETTTYWLTNTSVYTLPNEFVGMVDHQGMPTSQNNYNGGLIFDCFEPFLLARTKVITDVPGERKIDLRNFDGDVLQSKIVNIPIGTSIIELNFDVPAGTDFLLTTDGTFNSNSIGSNGPQLRRSSEGCAYPYQIPGVVSIKNSTADLTRYYYFYNWEIAYYGQVCISERIPVTVVVNDPSGVAALADWASSLRVFPNPSTGALNIDIQGFAGGELLAVIKNAQGQTLQTRVFNALEGDAAFSTDLNGFPAGIYWLELAEKGGIVQRKVVVR